jgi:LPXTG-motif cell wall-anchored protein
MVAGETNRDAQNHALLAIGALLALLSGLGIYLIVF